MSGDGIERKWTVEFQFAEVKVDFTVCVGPVDSSLSGEGHGPFQLTCSMRKAFGTLPSRARQLQRLAVDWAKSEGVCWDRTGDWVSYGRLKAVHWAMLVAAWWTYHVDRDHEHIELGRLLFEVLRFYTMFEFDNFAIAPMTGAELRKQPFIPRNVSASFSASRILLLDPMALSRGKWRN